MKRPSPTTLAAAGAGLLVALLYVSPVLRDVLHTGLDWPIWIQHREGASLTTYGKWWVMAPHRYLTDAFSGDFPTYYPSLSDTLINVIAALGSWPAMTVQAVIYGPLLGGLFLWLNYASIARVVRDPTVALGASLILSLGGSSGLARWLDPALEYHLSFYLHVPFQALSLGSGQSLGWVLFLPCLCLTYLAYREFTVLRAIGSGACLGFLLQVHTLTFITAAFVQLVYLTLSNALERPRDRGWKIWAISIGVIAVSFAGYTAARRPFSVLSLVAFGSLALLADFLHDPAKRFYAWSYGTAGLVAAPYLLALARNARGAAALQEAWVPGLAVGTFDLLLFFAAYGLAAALAYATCRDRPVLLWVSSVLAGTLFLAFNHLWGWSNHPYRFAIHLIFPLGILAALGLRHGPRRLAVGLGAWLGLLMLWNAWSFLAGDRVWITFRVGSLERAAFLGRVREETTARERSGVRILNPPEMDYPNGLFQSTVLMNYSRIPAFIPDYRYLLGRERYYNRMGVFCFLFPGYPNYDLPYGRRACEEQLDPEPEVLEILDPRLKTGILPLYSIGLAGAVGGPFAIFLKEAGATYGWPILGKTEGNVALLETEVAPLPGVARLGPGSFGPTGLDLDVETDASGRQLVILGGRHLADRAQRIEIDDRPLQGLVRSPNWAVGGQEVAAGRHRLHLAWQKPDYLLESDFLYFASVIQEAWAGRYVRLPHDLRSVVGEGTPTADRRLVRCVAVLPLEGRHRLACRAQKLLLHQAFDPCVGLQLEDPRQQAHPDEAGEAGEEDRLRHGRQPEPRAGRPEPAGQQSSGQTSGTGPSVPRAGRSGAPRCRSSTSSRTMDTKRGWDPAVPARTRFRPSSSALPRASRSRSYRTSMWSETKPMGATTTSVAPWSRSTRR